MESVKTKTPKPKHTQHIDRGASPGSVGQYGWSGAASTHVNIDKNEKTVSLLFCQHFPFNQHGIFEKFHTLTYSALK